MPRRDSNAPAGIKAALLARVTPANTAFVTKYNQWVNGRAALAGATVGYQNLLASLSSEGIEDLETAFKAVHRRGTPQHATVFAGGRAPYQRGSDNERVDALENLKTRMQNLSEPALASAIALATGLLTPLQAARSASTDADSAMELARTQIEPLRVALAVALYKNMAGLMQELGPSEDVAAFFDLELLRQSGGEDEGGGGGPTTVPAKPVVTVDGLSTNTQTGHAVSAGATSFRWFLKTTVDGDYVQIGEGAADFIEMTGLSDANNFLKCVAINSVGESEESDPVQFPGGL